LRHNFLGNGLWEVANHHFRDRPWPRHLASALLRSAHCHLGLQGSQNARRGARKSPCPAKQVIPGTSLARLSLQCCTWGCFSQCVSIRIRMLQTEDASIFNAPCVRATH
jgi:hypothetical protein